MHSSLSGLRGARRTWATLQFFPGLLLLSKEKAISRKTPPSNFLVCAPSPSYPPVSTGRPGSRCVFPSTISLDPSISILFSFVLNLCCFFPPATPRDAIPETVLTKKNSTGLRFARDATHSRLTPGRLPRPRPVPRLDTRRRQKKARPPHLDGRRGESSPPSATLPHCNTPFSRPLRVWPFHFPPPPSPTWSRLPKREASLASRASASGAAAQHHLPIPMGQ